MPYCFNYPQFSLKTIRNNLISLNLFADTGFRAMLGRYKEQTNAVPAAVFLLNQQRETIYPWLILFGCNLITAKLAV